MLARASWQLHDSRVLTGNVLGKGTRARIGVWLRKLRLRADNSIMVLVEIHTSRHAVSA